VADLLRVVAVGGVLTPDPRRRLPGRGAHVHLDRHCLEAAFRRRAFGRALRTTAPLDTDSLRRYVEGQVQQVTTIHTEPEADRHG
jgi:predicted RNA-binding protein YlxR (DUF448 family)